MGLGDFTPPRVGPRPRWMHALALAVVTLLVAAGAAVAIERLRARGDDARRAQTELTELHKDAEQQHALEWETMARGALTPDLRERFAAIRKDIAGCLEEPGLAIVSPAILDAIHRRFAVYHSAVDVELAALARGDTVAADRADEQLVDPAYAVLSEELESAVEHLDARATSSSQTAAVGTYTIMLAAAIIILALAWLFRRQRVETAELRREATTDGLTGLLNHRGFRESLDEQVLAAVAAGRPLSVVIMDIDHFKLVNDSHGHERGDRVLREMGGRLSALARDGEVIGRLGGEEFGWILPGASGSDALHAAERARRAVREQPFDGLPITMSAGVCDLETSGGVATMLRFADGALYWAKEQGRDLTVLYSPAVVTELSPADRAERMVRAQSLGALRALARVVDASDPDTHRHSERVAEWSVAIARRLGWHADALLLLRDAALLHDIGKIALPESILRKPGPLTPAQVEEVRRHPALGAQIVSEVLAPEQVAWVRGHHERVDGRGYPDRLTPPALSEGARIIAVADAWDAMTTNRPYRAALGVDDALIELRAGAGSQWWDDAVDALTALVLNDHRPADSPPRPLALTSG